MSQKIVCTNKKARHDYSIDSVIEAGIILSGPEVKSLRAGKANHRDGYARANPKGKTAERNQEPG